jgi:hypothetical protein
MNLSADSAATPAPAPVLAFHTNYATELDGWVAQLPSGPRAHAHRQELHFMRRVRERYGLTVSPRQYRWWIEKVERVLPGTKFLRFGACAQRTFWSLRSGSYTVRVLYDESTRRLITCVPPRFEQLPMKRARRLRATQAFVDADHLAKTRRLAAA